MSKDVITFARKHQQQNLKYLQELLRIPSVSTDPEHHPDIERAAHWLAERMQAIGLDQAAVIDTPGHPVVYGQWQGAGEDAPTLLVYGHYDVQPPDPEDEWVTQPFEPTTRQGNLYARGASDDKGQLYVHLAAAEAFMNAQGELPVNLKFMLEGEEEVGSPSLAAFINEHQDKLACDVALISDTPLLDAETPSITYSVRGIAYMEVEIQGPRHDLHSGSYGGVVHNPLQVAAEILAALHDERGRVTVPGFYDHVRPLTEEERAHLRDIPFDEEAFRREAVGAPALWSGEAGYTPVERLGARPTLEIHGIKGGFTGAGQKTVIPARASFKVSMRLVADQNPRKIAERFARHIEALAPPTVTVKVRSLATAEPAIIDRDAHAMQAAAQAYRQGFGAAPLFIRAGGTLPVVPMLRKILHAPVVMMGFGLPDDHIHAPNEKMSVQNFLRGIETSIYFIEALATQVD
jgi:acetylornithine deacetylase/succinyl-diaminopimelate desuccinylase-like protein